MPQAKLLRVKIQAKPLEQLPILQILVQHPGQKLQAQTLEPHPALTTQAPRLRTILAIPGRLVTQEPLARPAQALLEPLALQEPLGPPRILTVRRKAPASRRFPRNAPGTASTVPAKVLMIQDKTMIQVSTMTQVSTNQGHN